MLPDAETDNSTGEKARAAAGGAWHPLLTGELAERAHEAVEAVAAALEDGVAQANNPGVAAGTAGFAVFHAYRARSLGGDPLRAQETLDAAIDAVATQPLDASLFAGFPGVAWAVEHLRGDAGGDDANEDVDSLLLDWLERPSSSLGYDLVSGLVGVGVYALERLGQRAPDSAAAACLARIVGHLDALATQDAAGTTWLTPPERIPTFHQAPEGYFNLGLAHGVPGVIGLLSGAVRAGIEAEHARTLLDGAVRWVLAQSKPDGFPAWVGPGITPGTSRSAWCYGDPGVAAALLLAARAAGEPAWEREAIAAARRAATRPATEDGIVDAGLCHGAAGVGHILHRLARATGDELLAGAARALFARALDLRRPGEGVAGFGLVTFDDPRTGAHRRWEAAPGLLEGAAGVGLALIAALSHTAPAWDRLLLLSSR